MTTAIDDDLDWQIRARHTPGALVHVERAGQVVARRAVGRIHPDRDDQPMHDGVRFRIASLTKPVVSVAALMLADEGRLDLDAPAAEWLPPLRAWRLPDGSPPPRPPTVRDLLRHTSGIAHPAEIADPAVRARWSEAEFPPSMRGVTAEAFVERIARLPLVAPPGTVFRYGRSTDVLGCIVERADGRPLGEVLRRRLFEPLGMRRTGFTIDDGEEDALPSAFAEDAAWHTIVPAIGHRAADTAAGSMHSGGGGLLSTIDDYAAFARLLADGGVHDGRPLVSAAAMAELGRNQLPAGVEGPTGYTGPGFGFGLGLAVRLDWGAAAMPCTAGELTWSGISGTALFVQPKERWFALMFSSNMTSRMMARLGFRRAVGR